MLGIELAVFSKARLTLIGEYGTFLALRAERTRAKPPQAFGVDMEVPSISSQPRKVQLGTEAMAPPGAEIETPEAPSVVGPREDQPGETRPGRGSREEWAICKKEVWNVKMYLYTKVFLILMSLYCSQEI